MPYRKEYAQPGILYPVSNHCLSISREEFTTVAYAFLMSLNRLGAGNPKGVALARGGWEGGVEPLLVVDEYRVPLGERPILSPSLTDNDEAVKTFVQLAEDFRSEQPEKFRRSTGASALKVLQDAAVLFEEKFLKA
jgi:hypothetical protein